VNRDATRRAGSPDAERAGAAAPADEGPLAHTRLLEEAIRFGVAAHHGQVRKGDGQPFITHPIAVALLCARAGLDAETIAAALLHDVVEDTAHTAEDVESRTSPRVRAAVEAVTKHEGGNVPRRDGESLWRAKGRLYTDRLRTADRPGLAVAAADKIHNLDSLVRAYRENGREALDRFRSKIPERLSFYADVRDVVRERWPDCPLLPELERQLARARAALPEE
jgi:(p)ppGpp synthase/HD superfamily hydrolase